MSLGKHLGFALLAVLTSALAACSGGGSGVAGNSIANVVQDLTVDPEGTTTVVTFEKRIR